MKKQLVKMKPKPGYKVTCDSWANVCAKTVKISVQVAVAAFIAGFGFSFYADRREAKEKNQKVIRQNNPKL